MNDLQLDQLKSEIRFRDDEIDLLNGFITEDARSSIPCLMVHGYKSVGKTLTVTKFLEKLGVTTSVVSSDENLTNKLLFENCMKSIQRDSGYKSTLRYHYVKSNLSHSTDTFSNFALNLQRFLQVTGYKKHHVLVLDRVDQNEDPFTLINSFVKLHDCYDVKNFSIIMISNNELPSQTITNSVPHIYFRPYSEPEIISIFQKNQFCFFDDEKSNNNGIGKQFWDTYVQVIVELFFDYTGSDLYSLINLCSKNWYKFTKTIKNERTDIKGFIKIYRENKDMFQDDTLLNSRIVNCQCEHPEKHGTALSLDDMTHLSKFILLGAYLASYIDPKSDPNLFTSVKSSHHKMAKKKLSEITKKDLDVKLLQPSYFDLERLFAIVLTIYRNDSKSFQDQSKDPLAETNHLFELDELEFSEKQQEMDEFTLAGNIDLYSQLAALLGQGYLYRQTTRDILQPKTRWRCDIGWDVAQAIAKDVDFPLENYLN